MKSWIRRRKWWIAGCAAVLIAVVLANRQAIQFGLAVAMSEHRPSLLDDAQWDQPSSARHFNAMFAPGTSVEPLTTWLRDNHFDIIRDDKGGHASRKIAGLPCNEMIQVGWTDGTPGRIATAQATVSEAGCL